FTRSARCVTAEEFSEVPLAEIENGLPEDRRKTPFNCQPPAIFAATPLFSRALPLPKGSSSTNVSEKWCVRSLLIKDRPRKRYCGMTMFGPLSACWLQQIPVCLEKV